MLDSCMLFVSRMRSSCHSNHACPIRAIDALFAVEAVKRRCNRTTVATRTPHARALYARTEKSIRAWTVLACDSRAFAAAK
eukprot:177901-Lingulodinium_polyedra.AAC.1